MSLSDNISAAFTQVGADVGLLQDLQNGGAADLSALTTTAKQNLVVALNEVNARANGIINDVSVSTTTTWSSNRLNNEIATLVSALSNRVSYDSVQSKTAAQQLQACQNIGVGNPEADLLLAYTTARDA